ncbi:MAG: DUF302 domain-containing protein [Bacteroidales bacterium]
MNNDEMILVSESKFSFDETIEQINLSIPEIGWKVVTTHNFQEIMLKNGTSISPLKVLEVCNPKYASQLLTVDSLLMYSPLMPCRISVYEDSNGQCFISRMNSAAMAAMIGGIVYDVMSKANEDMEGLLRKISKKPTVL